MTAVGWLWVLAALLALAVLAFALTRRPRRPRPDDPPPRPSRDAVERFWDTPEHSDAWDDEHPGERR